MMILTMLSLILRTLFPFICKHHQTYSPMPVILHTLIHDIDYCFLCKYHGFTVLVIEHEQYWQCCVYSPSCPKIHRLPDDDGYPFSTTTSFSPISSIESNMFHPCDPAGCKMIEVSFLLSTSITYLRMRNTMGQMNTGDKRQNCVRKECYDIPVCIHLLTDSTSA